MISVTFLLTYYGMYSGNYWRREKLAKLQKMAIGEEKFWQSLQRHFVYICNHALNLVG